MPFDATSKSHVKLELLVTNKNKKHLFQYQLLRHISSLNEGTTNTYGRNFFFNPREIDLIFCFRHIFCLAQLHSFLTQRFIILGELLHFSCRNYSNKACKDKTITKKKPDKKPDGRNRLMC